MCSSRRSSYGATEVSGVRIVIGDGSDSGGSAKSGRRTPSSGRRTPASGGSVTPVSGSRTPLSGSRSPYNEAALMPLLTGPPKTYGSLFPYYHFMKQAAKNSSQTLHRSESMVSLCFKSLAVFVTDDNLPGLQSFLERNKQAALDEKDEDGITALILASNKGRTAIVRELLDHGAEPNIEDGDGWTALLYAAREGYVDICHELIEHQADIEHRDMGGWTALMWASYKGRNDVVLLLINKGADVNAHGNFHMSSLIWAAGRGHAVIARTLINNGAKVNVGDKYGTSALVWASRKGNAEIVDALLRAGANVDTAGMYSWTALLVATMGNFVEVVHLLLEHKPNVNALDKDGCTALTIACKEGYHEIAVGLLNAGAYINIQDRAGDTNLIHAVKGNHRSVVEALLKKYADVDITGKDRKTAIYNAVEKGNVSIVKLLLHSNPDLEISTKDGDTPLLRAVRTRNVEVVQLLLDKKAKVSAADKKGDTALHVAMRARSKAIIEVLLRNPKHSQLLYRPNRQGETPYNIDLSHQKTILGQIFGARRLNTNEDSENMLGYDLYSSALADMLSEPSLSMPITVGLYAKWGSGKSFLLNKLREEMKNFAKQWVEPNFEFSFLLFLIVLHTSVIVGCIVGLALKSWIVGLAVGASILFSIHTFLVVVKFIGKRYDWDWPYNFSKMLTRKLNAFKLLLQIIFCHPPGSVSSDGLAAQPIRFYFTDQTRVSSTTSSENSIVQMLGSLYDSIEMDYGTFSTRLYRAFQPKPIKKNTTWRWRRLCCLPYVIIFELCFMSLLASAILCVYYFDGTQEPVLRIILITIAAILAVAIIANLYTWGRMFKALMRSQRRHLQCSISNLETLKSEGFLQALRLEVSLMTDMVRCLDRLTFQQTRLVIIVDGLDSCEQDKVLLILDAVHLLFSDANCPFIVILAIDPHTISKALEMNSKRLFNESNIGSHDYLRNMVHLPFYLQNSGLRRVKVAQHTAQMFRRAGGLSEDHCAGPSSLGRSVSHRRLSSESGLMSSNEKLKPPAHKKGSRKLKLSESIASSIGSNLNRVGGANDLTKMLLTDDYFSDVNPRSMRRLMNVVYITGRLLKAFQIDFNWYHLASWVNITEQWPFRTSWIIFYHETNEDMFEDNTPLKNLYDKMKPQIPILKEIEPLLELDRDERKFDVFLTFHRASLLVSDLKIFLPFTINLDPYIKKAIKEQHNLEEEGLVMPQTTKQQMQISGPLPWQSTQTPVWSSSPIKQGPTRRQRWSKCIQPYMGPEVIYPPPGVLPWGSPPWMEQQIGPSIGAQSTQLSAVTTLPKELFEYKLSTLSVNDICDLINKLDDISPNMKSRYANSVKENNISGKVLLHCNLDELKQVLSMSFGDWEMFRMMVVCLREQELSFVTNQDEIATTSHHQTRPTQRPSNVSLRAVAIDKLPAAQSASDTTLSMSGLARTTTKQTQMEKQVTLEEQMICGALQTLNEEACEDVLVEGDTKSLDPESSDDAMMPAIIMPPISVSGHTHPPEADIYLTNMNEQHSKSHQTLRPVSSGDISKIVEPRDTGVTHSSMYGQNSKHDSIIRGGRIATSSTHSVNNNTTQNSAAQVQIQRPVSFPNTVETTHPSTAPSERCVSLINQDRLTPSSSLEKLTMLKERFLSFKNLNRESDSEDESTPLVSDKSKSELTSIDDSPLTPGSNTGFYAHTPTSNPNLTDFTDVSPNVRCIESPKSRPYNSNVVVADDNFMNTHDLLTNSASDVSLTCVLEPTSYYQLVAIDQSSSLPSVSSTNSGRAESGLSRQNAIDDGDDMELSWDPETTV